MLGRGVAQDDCMEKCARQCTSQTMGGVGWLWARVNSSRRNSEWRVLIWVARGLSVQGIK